MFVKNDEKRVGEKAAKIVLRPKLRCSVSHVNVKIHSCEPRKSTLLQTFGFSLACQDSKRLAVHPGWNSLEHARERLTAAKKSAGIGGSTVFQVTAI